MVTTTAHSATSGSNRHKNYPSGMTLVELMIVLAIVAILATIAVPSFQKQIASSRLVSTTNNLVSTLTQARNEAIRQGKRVTVCRSSDGTACTTATGTGWEIGWITFVDITRSSSATGDAGVDTGETPLTQTPSAPTAILVRGNARAINYVSYAADGSPKVINGTALAGDGVIRVCSTQSALTNSERARDIFMNTVGRVVSAKVSSVAISCTAPT